MEANITLLMIHLKQTPLW